VNYTVIDASRLIEVGCRAGSGASERASEASFVLYIGDVAAFPAPAVAAIAQLGRMSDFR
jgi:hypothetical protein